MTNNINLIWTGQINWQLGAPTAMNSINEKNKTYISRHQSERGENREEDIQDIYNSQHVELNVPVQLNCLVSPAMWEIESRALVSELLSCRHEWLNLILNVVFSSSVCVLCYSVLTFLFAACEMPLLSLRIFDFRSIVDSFLPPSKWNSNMGILLLNKCARN